MLTRNRLSIGVALLAGVCLTACGGAQSRYQSHMNRGQEYFSQGDYTKASIEFRNALQIEPKNVEAQLAAGRSAEKLRRPRDAYSLYQSVVDSSPDNIEAREDMARLLVYSNSADAALKMLAPAFVKHPNEALLYALRAAARTQLKDTSGATADADRALQLAPDNEEAVEVRAGLYKQAGDISGAKTLVGRAVHDMPKSRPLREMLVDLDLAGHDPDLAERTLIDLIKLAPEEARYRYQLAVIYARSKQPEEAQRVLEEAVKDLPKSDQPKLTLVDFMEAQRGRAQAEQVMKGFVDKDPDNHDLRLGLGSLQQRNGETKEAIATYDEVIQRAGTEPSGLTARDRLAGIAVTQGRAADARKLIEESLQKNPRDDVALELRADMELAQADPAAAIGDLRAVLRDYPRAVGAQGALARAYIANGQAGLAEQSLHTAIDASPKDVGLRVELAQLLLQTQRADQAVAMLEETVRQAPSDPAARTELVRAYLGMQDFASARKSAEDLKTLRPESGEGSYYAGMAAVGQNKLDEAQKEFERALTLQPQASGPLTALVRLYIARGMAPQAMALVKNAAEHDPGNVQTLNLLGELYLGQSDFKQADDTFSRIIAKTPGWWAPYRGLASSKLQAKDLPGAIAAYQAGIKAAPTELQLVNDLAILYETSGRSDDAIALYETTYRSNPQAPGIANNLALLLVTYKQDRASLDRARDLAAGFASSSDGNLLDTYGWVHFKRGEYAEALPVLGRAADRAPNSKEIHYHLGMAELHAGQTDRARTDLEAAVSGSAKFPGAEEARVTLASLRSNAG